MTSWKGVPVQVTSRIIGRYAWTTATIDVSINGNTVLRTDGVAKLQAARQLHLNMNIRGTKLFCAGKVVR